MADLLDEEKLPQTVHLGKPGFKKLMDEVSILGAYSALVQKCV